MQSHCFCHSWATSLLLSRRGKPLRNRFLPPYLKNSETIEHLPGRRHNRYTQTSPFISRHPSFGQRNINRKMDWYIKYQKKACVQDEEGNFWFRGTLEAALMEKEMEKDVEEEVDTGSDSSTADSGLGDTLRTTDEGSPPSIWKSGKDQDGAVIPDLDMHFNSDEIVDFDNEILNNLSTIKIADRKFCRKRQHIRSNKLKNWTSDQFFKFYFM
ncbi:uncharacterized protein LOC118436067 [Folsomia candida]|nr:uncharacterized protein LOC118436067 [Folsomia candida]